MTRAHRVKVTREVYGTHVARCSCGWRCSACPDRDRIEQLGGEHAGMVTSRRTPTVTEAWLVRRFLARGLRAFRVLRSAEAPLLRYRRR